MQNDWFTVPAAAHVQEHAGPEMDSNDVLVLKSSNESKQ